MLEIHGVERAGFTRIAGMNFGSWNSGRNNEQLEEVWESLETASLGTLTVGFNNLYYFGGAFSPAYDTKGILGQKPPEAKFQIDDSGEVKVLFPAYKSIVYGRVVRPAVLGVWIRETHPELMEFVAGLLK